MFHYAVFGRCFRSEVAFPDLPETAAREAAWTLRVAAGARSGPTGTEVGRLTAGGGRTLVLSRVPEGLYLAFPPIGECTISDAGREFAWYPGIESNEELMRLVMLGPAFALALQEAGTLCLHGSAIGIGGRAVALLAPKFHGKSTLALALTRAGAELITDDAIAIDLEPFPTARPGVHSVRLFEDSVDRLMGESLPGRILPGGKNTVVDLPPHMLAAEPLPMGAIYLLAPVAAQGTDRPAVVRTALRLPDATVALAGHTKLADPLIGLAAAADQLRWASTLVRAVPVYVLQHVRNFDRLAEVVAQLFDWHDDAASHLARATA